MRTKPMSRAGASESFPLRTAVAVVLTAAGLAGGALCADEPARLQPGATAQEPGGNDPSGTNAGADKDVLDLDIEQLGKVDVVVPSFDATVSSVTGSESTVGKSPAAVFVMTPEMIRRSGKTSVPELLRLVPGLEVARIDANKWAIASRGFNSRFANKLLVLIDGRSVYNPLSSGVYWDIQDVMLEDIERIEVIRGPGATVWGANAVNGVINIITKKASDTQGSLVSAGGGTQDNFLGATRYGGSNGDNFHYRIFSKYTDRDSSFARGGAHDDWRLGHVGFRSDWLPNHDDSDVVTLIGDLYAAQAGRMSAEPFPLAPFETNVVSDTEAAGGDVVWRWTHNIDDTSNWWIQTYYDRTNRQDVDVNQSVDIFDLQFQHLFVPCERHSLTWGLNYRLVHDETGFPDPFGFELDPAQRTTNLYGTFIQDEITLADALKLYVGSKFEHNDYSGFEYQPGVRMLWTVDPRRVVWTAISRAVRTPSRTESASSIRSVIVPPLMGQFSGNNSLEAENLTAYEMGYRVQQTDTFSWDAALFYNDYDDLIGLAPLGPPAGFPPTIPFRFDNVADGGAYGVELTAQKELSESWRISGWYAFLQLQVDGSSTQGQIQTERSSPHNQVAFMSSWDLPRNFEFDIISRYVDNVPFVDAAHYISMDLRLGWRPSAEWEFAIVGQNLLEEHRREFIDKLSDNQPTEVNRGVFAQAIWKH